MARRILVLHGPNLNLRGERSGDASDVTLASIDRALTDAARAAGAELRAVQSNHEGALVDSLQKERRWAEAVLVDPGPLAISGHVLADAIGAVGLPSLELSRTRRKSVLTCDAVVIGDDVATYVAALDRLLRDDSAGKQRSAKAPPASATVKSIGRGAGGSRNATSSSSPAPGSKPAPTRSAGPQATKSHPTGAAKSPRDDAPVSIPAKSGKTIGRAAPASSPRVEKSIGRARGETGSTATSALTRTKVRDRIAERLRGELTPSALATWARQQYLALESGAPSENGQREVLEDTLQRLTLSAHPASRMTEEELVEMMSQLEG